MSNVFIKTKIFSGHYAVEYMRNIHGKRIMVVCDQFLSESGAVRYVTETLDSSNEVVIFDQAIPDPTIEVVGKGVAMICRIHPDIVIGFGGGSAIDTAKGILYFAGIKKLISKPQFITIPTTSGTGSEVTSVAVITDPESRAKHLIASDDILADTALLDAGLTLSVPPSVTANTGMDVLTHALEAYVAYNANTFSDALAEKAVELLTKSLLSCFQNGKNLEARTCMHEASTLAGMAFNTAGLGVNHSIAHQLGGTFHIPHGLANAILLNRVIDYNCADYGIMRKYGALACKVQLTGSSESPALAVSALTEKITLLMRCMKMPFTIRELGISKEDYEKQIPNMTANALMDFCLGTTPRAIGAAAIKEILLSIY